MQLHSSLIQLIVYDMIVSFRITADYDAGESSRKQLDTGVSERDSLAFDGTCKEQFDTWRHSSLHLYRLELVVIRRQRQDLGQNCFAIYLLKDLSTGL